jgi:hypothetical protein
MTKNMGYEAPYYATFSFIPLLAVMSKYIFPSTTHLLSFYT